ncbi:MULTISPECIES: substrate-binding periplasmic protein [unclassified Acinetobacter]
MNTLPKFITCATTLALSFGLVACGEKSTETNTQATNKAHNSPASAPAAAADTMHPVSNFVSKLPENAPVLNVGITGDTAPFSYVNEKGLIEGLDIDVIQDIAENAGYRVKFSRHSWNDMFACVEKAECDVAISGISWKPERAEKYALSNSYIANPASVMTLDPNLKTLAALKGMKVGGLDGGKSFDMANSVGASAVTTDKTPYLAFSRLARKEVNAIIYDYPVLKHLQNTYPDIKFAINPVESVDSDSAKTVIMAAKDKTALIDKINQNLATLQSSGELEKIKDKWLGNS